MAVVVEYLHGVRASVPHGHRRSYGRGFVNLNRFIAFKNFCLDLPWSW
jgi:hypothetical protein